jgi:nucleotide-binding universal stress UspA family protein
MKLSHAEVNFNCCDSEKTDAQKRLFAGKMPPFKPSRRKPATPFSYQLLLTVDPQMIEDTPARYKQRMQAHSETTLAAAAQAAQAAGVFCEVLSVEHEHPYQAIIDTAAAKGCDLIVMASRGRRGMAALLLGSETVKVLTHSRIPVLVYR